MKAFGSWISITITIAIIYLVGISIGYAHGGGLSGLGCHNDRAIGNVHCHRGEFAGMTFDNLAELLVATTTKPDWTTATEYPNDYPFTMITAKVLRGPYVCNAIFVKPQSLPADENWGNFHEFEQCRHRNIEDELWINPPRENNDSATIIISDDDIIATGRNVFELLKERSNDNPPITMSDLPVDAQKCFVNPCLIILDGTTHWKNADTTSDQWLQVWQDTREIHPRLANEPRR